MFSLVWLFLPGCRPGVSFPAQPLVSSDSRADYDTDGDGRADFFFLFDRSGRVDRIGYDRDRDGQPDDIVPLDAVNPRLVRHLVLVLDGIPLDVVRQFRQAGGLRVFPPPAVVIPPYPVMTDLALEDAFGYVPCPGFEAKYFDRKANTVVGGTLDYLAGKNEPFTRIVDYRASALDDGLAYLKPKAMFDKELAEAKRLWDRRRGMETVAYFVASAGMGSRMGREGQVYVLKRCEQLINQVLMESRGLVKVTLFADHGQSNVPCSPAGLSKHLKDAGYRLVKRLERDGDVVLINFGLVTYAGLNTFAAARLADDLLKSDAVELLSYVQGGDVVVRTRDGKAIIRSSDGKTFEYERLVGDPLKLAGLVEGKIDGRDLLAATVKGRHQYPDPLYRVWRAHFALAENTPDVIVSLDDRYYNGSGLFSGAVTMASTHGGLNWANSATFIMSTAGPIKGPLRSEDIPGVMEKIFARPFPAGR